MNSIADITTYDPSLGRKSTTPSQTLDSDSFMQLLVAQLRYQDPLKGTDQQAFMQQLSTMSSMQQQQEINSNLSGLVQSQAVTQAAGLVGKTIKGYDADGKEVTGVVKSAVIDSETAKLQVGTSTVAMSDVYEID